MQADAQSLKEREFERVQKRCDDLREQVTKLELSYNHASENLDHVTQDIERLRTECASLRAEKSIWKVSANFF
jgi:nucleoprotein TPR